MLSDSACQFDFRIATLTAGLEIATAKWLEVERDTKKLRRVPRTVAKSNLDAIALDFAGAYPEFIEGTATEEG